MKYDKKRKFYKMTKKKKKAQNERYTCLWAEY